ncbi:hypothetical protein [Bifidobacterium longum]|uniref:hypothetical protein n=1 Tax=Bifidobacterium longum TaxID=216816 RepID=UPI0010EB54C0|nr:hypothetical protein [Bifidobacterium longum]TCF09486.1 hypothetical protein MCC10081_0616 [Bifidobacterium longum subsp. longum]TCF15682.1 hypothetical protein MCC10085_0645 [Bifidobacterium longum subsp. longum]TCF90910.1 hypothetical protein MCC10130_0635 [Bifidobacterium longum subsp. longum]
MTASTSRRASSASTPDVPNDMWLAVAARLLPNLDILTAHPTRQSLASLIGLSIHEAGLRLVGLREDTDDDDGHGNGGTVEPDHGRGA